MFILCTERGRIHLAHHLAVTHHDGTVNLRLRIGQKRIEESRHLSRPDADSLRRRSRQVVHLPESSGAHQEQSSKRTFPFHHIFRCVTSREGPASLQEDAEQNERDADIERVVDFATLAENDKGQDNRVTGFEIIGQVDCEGREALQGLNLQEIHTHRTEQGMTEHQPKVGSIGHNDNRLPAREEKQIDRDNRRNQHKPT